MLEATGENTRSDQHIKSRSNEPEFIQVNAFGSSVGRPPACADARLWRDLQEKLEQCLVYIWQGNASEFRRALFELRVLKPKAKPPEWPEWRKQMRFVSKKPFQTEALDELA